MIWCEIGGAEANDFEDLAAFASQLNALGFAAGVDVRSAPAGLSRNAQFDLAPYFLDGAPEPGDLVVIVGAQRLADEKLVQLRRLAGPDPQPCLAIGAFASRQGVIGARAKLSYVFGQDPRVVDLAEAGCSEEVSRGCPVFGVPARRRGGGPPRLLVVEPDLDDARQASALVNLSLSRRHEVGVLTNGKTKQGWINAHGPSIPFYHYGETLPFSLAARVDVLVTFTTLQGNYRLQCLVANLLTSGAALLDGTAGHGLARASEAFIRGPLDLPALQAFLAAEVLPNLEAIAEHVPTTAAAVRSSGEEMIRLLAEVGASETLRRNRTPMKRRGASRIVFAPTNGVGLGHAQRCALIAAELDPVRFKAEFAVFPSCAGLVKAYGFDAMPLIARSPLHAQPHENDLANYVRLRALCAQAATLVFDGGYVFDSVYRTILEKRLRAIWIRRGLWQRGQANEIALDREKAFARVIVPSEAFEELNEGYSAGEHVRRVGPVVQRTALDPARRAALRAALADRYARPFEHLVVTQLGAGVAADRGAQVQAICGMIESRRDVLNLVVVWPMSTLQPGWFGWSNSRVVRTRHAGAIAAAADVCIGAAGYNSFHESLYGGAPTIFVPQAASIMDDQRARAAAAAERGLAALIEPNELMTLEREIARFLAGEGAAVRERLAAFELPPPGNVQAAALIQEMVDGTEALDGRDVADRAAGRGRSR